MLTFSAAYVHPLTAGRLPPVQPDGLWHGRYDACGCSTLCYACKCPGAGDQDRQSVPAYLWEFLDSRNLPASYWEQEFQSQETALTVAEQPQREAPAPDRQHDGDELARIAGELVDTVKDAANPKFKNSEFLGLMRQLRDGNVVVDGEKMVAREEASPDAALSSTDVKGKGRAVEPTPIYSAPGVDAFQGARPIGHEETRAAFLEEPSVQLHEEYQEGPIDAYLRKENEDYIRMQQAYDAVPAADFTYEWWNTSQRSQDADWGRLQRDWDSFEATVTGIRPLAHYQFQPHNPYVLGEASRTHHHAMHLDSRSSIFEVCQW